jgi:hypothetical protein
MAIHNGNALLARYPALYFVLGVVIASNNLLKYAPAQAMSGALGVIIPLLCFAFGVGAFAKRRLDARAA